MAVNRKRVFVLEQLEPEVDEDDVDPEFMLETLGFMTQQKAGDVQARAAAIRF